MSPIEAPAPAASSRVGPPVIVVGAGSAGCVVAARLVRAGVDVVLLEAGPTPADAAFPAEVRSPNFLAACALEGWTWPTIVGRRTPQQEPRVYLRGRGLGGSSAVNAMVGLWGTPDDHRDAPPGWAWDDLAAARAEVEAVVGRQSFPRASWSPLERAVAAAALDAGHAWCPEAGAHTPGVGPAPLTMLDGRRISAADAWLTPWRDSPRLGLRGDRDVDTVLLDGHRAVGVRLANGEEIEGRAVVLCAGAIGSPTVLLRSGVQRAGIGVGLADHPSAGVAVLLRPEARVTGSDRLVSMLVHYSSGLGDAGPGDMQLLTLAASGSSDELLAVGVVQVAVMAAFSRGSVTIDAAGAPVVDFDLLGDERDRARLRDGMRRLAALLDHPAIAEVATDVLAVPATGARLADLALDDESLDAWLAHHTGDYVHAACTARMGPEAGPAAVVSPGDGAVWGYDALHVIDASVLHRLPRANTHFPTMAAADRLADGLLETLGRSVRPGR